MCHQPRKSSAGCAILGTEVGVRARIWGRGFWVRVVDERLLPLAPCVPLRCTLPGQSNWPLTGGHEPGMKLKVPRRRLRACVQIWGGYRKAFSNVRSHIRPTRRHFRKEPQSDSDRSRWSLQSLSVPAIPIRVAQNQTLQQDRARAQRRIQPRPPSVSFWDSTSCPQLALTGQLWTPKRLFF